MDPGNNSDDAKQMRDVFGRLDEYIKDLSEEENVDDSIYSRLTWIHNELGLLVQLLDYELYNKSFGFEMEKKDQSELMDWIKVEVDKMVDAEKEGEPTRTLYCTPAFMARKFIDETQRPKRP
jgi:hypothetical protein